MSGISRRPRRREMRRRESPTDADPISGELVPQDGSGAGYISSVKTTRANLKHTERSPSILSAEMGCAVSTFKMDLAPNGCILYRARRVRGYNGKLKLVRDERAIVLSLFDRG